ncbi:hypothetical protein [Nocardioides marmoribigeumensis]|uniref:SMI1/KNR4 family protein n=1 Tax=Nocardioides marmoribigeumensis TaxID=433649 RepID=A0ABU2BQZ3_9ACTN|nr:hypothetical protein [Nocardioides marmoribigeumensis]MDR7360686.1 hypothetical protein [Nocardioides marmoribigeumensis]
MSRPSPTLTDWIARWSRRPVLAGSPADLVRPLLSFNQATTGRDGDVELLVAEHQGVWLWGRDDRGAFVERENTPGKPWMPTGEDEAAFWLHHAAFEFLSSHFPAWRSTNDQTEDVAELLLEATDPLPVGEWRWPASRQRMRHREDSLAMVCDHGGLFWLVVGGPDEAALTWADALAVTWDETDSWREHHE